MRNQLVLTNVPIPIANIKLGCLVPDFSQPTIDAVAPLTPSSSDLNFAHQTTYRSLVKTYRKTALRPHLAFFGFDVSRDQDVDLIIESTRGMLYELKAPTDWFRKLCSDTAVQTWMEKRSLDKKSIFFITGYRTFVDARISNTNKTGREIGGNVDVPVDALATAAGMGIPISMGMHAGVDGSVKRSTKIEEAYVAPEEQVYAIQYRRVNLGWFRSHSADKATLDDKVCWKDVLKHRGVENGQDMVGAELGNALRLGRPTEKVMDESATDEYIVVLEE
jgi:hypothetical protein